MKSLNDNSKFSTALGCFVSLFKNEIVSELFASFKIFFPLDVPTATEEQYKIIFDYVPENDDELALQKGDIVTVTNKNVCDGWWEGIRNGHAGVFPNNFVETTPIVDVPPKDKVSGIS